ncbi:cytochrome oxidase maturation protein, cbb3-type [Shewanella frigidimarina NCIMB 400]|uniref:Cytochrome oxidase maturation protein, cbb3-type n=1 Tax=Shewanella frigidimarina (strain NCIMB 400) TaxID=318167 RepID=Q082F3_SHEFN|nr:cytochrome oxidase maturation protein, cbb3-type [Shewanella frigidimarina NCIMB 400]|tara:strand:+ start:10585 stop:10899 length:315 start_codon:yes stop_codon:yes gene_type:complete
MSIIYVLIPIAMLFVLIAVSIFFWAVKSEQFDDLDRQSVSILFDEDENSMNKNSSANADSSNDSSATNDFPTNSSPINRSATTDVAQQNTVGSAASSTTHTKPE